MVVTLLLKEPPAFPNRCVACGAAAPETTLGITTHSLGWWTLALAFGSRFHVDVPICNRCKRREFARLWIGRAVVVFLVVIGIALAVWLGWYKGWLRRWVAAGVGLACASPYLLWYLLFPPPVDVTAYANSVVYDFRDAQYAREFESLNEPFVERT